MAGTKWSAFPAGSTIGGTDVTVGLQGGADVQWTMAQLKTWTSASPTLVTPVLGVATGTSIALTGNPTFNGVLLDFSTNTQFTLTSPGPTNRATLGQVTRLPAAGSYTWTSGADSLGTIDLSLFRDAANTLAQRNGTTAQVYNIYNTFTDASNYERLSVAWAANIATISTAKAGTGSDRALRLTATGALQFAGSASAGSIEFYTGGFGSLLLSIANASANITSSANLLFSADNTYDIGANGATRPRNIYTSGSLFAAGTVNSTDNITCGAASGFGFQATRGWITAPSDGVFRISNNAITDFGRLQFGGTTSSFPSLKRSSTVLQGRLADDSAFAQVQGKLTTDTNATTGLGAGVLAALTNASITITDASGQVYRVPCVI